MRKNRILGDKITKNIPHCEINSPLCQKITSKTARKANVEFPESECGGRSHNDLLVCDRGYWNLVDGVDYFA